MAIASLHYHFPLGLTVPTAPPVITTGVADAKRGLSFYISENELKRLFLPFGVVKQARLIRDLKTQRAKGFGFVKFEKEVEAQKALKAMNGRIVQGRMIFVEFAQGSAEDANKHT